MPYHRRSRRPLSPLWQLRQIRTLTQAQMASLLGVSQQSYSKWEHGRLTPSAITQQRIAAVLGTTVADLWPPPTPERRGAPAEAPATRQE